MTPRERAEELARTAMLHGQRLNMTTLADIFEKALADAVEEDRTISDIPARMALDGVTKQCESLLTALKERTAERDAARERCHAERSAADTIERERDEARNILEQVKRGRDREVMDRNREIDAARTRIAELEAALRMAREWMGCMADPDEKTYGEYIADKRLVDAALSPSPAQPASHVVRNGASPEHGAGSDGLIQGTDTAQPGTNRDGFGWSPVCDSPRDFPCACGATHVDVDAPAQPATAEEDSDCECWIMGRTGSMFICPVHGSFNAAPAQPATAAKKIVRATDTPEAREFWRKADEAAAEVSTWADWKRAGINVAEQRETPRNTAPPSPAVPYCAHGINHSGERHGCDGCCKPSAVNSSNRDPVKKLTEALDDCVMLLNVVSGPRATGSNCSWCEAPIRQNGRGKIAIGHRPGCFVLRRKEAVDRAEAALDAARSK